MNPSDLHSPRPRQRRWLGLICGFVIVAALAVLAWWSGGGLQARDEYVTFLARPGGLAKGSPVTLQGLVAGRVRSLSLVEREGELGVEARFWVARQHAGWLRAGSRVVAVADLVGATQLELRPNLAASERLSPGAELPGELAPDAMTQIMALQPVVTDLIEEVGTLAAALTARTEQFDPILAGINRQVEGLGATQERVQALLTEAQALLGQAAADQQAVVASFNGVLGTVNTELLPQIGRTLEENNRRMDALFASVQRSTEAVEAKLPALLELSEATMRNSRDLTEAAANTWPFSRYMRRKAAAAAAEGEAGAGPR